MTVPRAGTRRRTPARVLATACALSLLFAACGGDDDGDDATDETTEASEETTTAPEEESTESEPAEESSTTAAEEPEGGEGEGDPEAVAVAEAINLTIDDFAEGWTADESDDDGEEDINQCFTTVDIDDTTVGEAETPTFSVETPDGTGGQVVSMQTVVLDSPDTATAVVAELATPEFATCARDLLLLTAPEGTTADLQPTVDDPPLGEESAGVAGALQTTNEAGEPQEGLIDLHAIRTAEVVSFTATIDIGGVGFEQTLQELYTVIADRHATEVG